MELFLDSETFSPTPIKNGHYRYAEDVEVMLLAFAFEDDEPEVIDLTQGQTIPKGVREAFRDPYITKIFHNSPFDRTVLREGLGLDIPTTQIYDTMVQALAHGLPGSLDRLCAVMGVPLEESKSEGGKDLIQLFCKPLPKNWTLKRATAETHPKEWAEFVTYAGQDIKAMRSIKNKMPRWNYKPINIEKAIDTLTPGEFEYQLWILDQRINDRGFLVDVDLAEKAVSAIKKEQKILARRTHDLTQGEVEKATQRDKLLFHICEYYGIILPDMRKSTIERRLNDPELPDAVRELLAIRLAAATTSTSKYNALLRCVCRDNKLRGTLQFDGATRTRRWSGRLFQPQNLPRPAHKQQDIDDAIDMLKLDALDIVDPDDIMGLCSSVIRGCIVAPKDKKLIISDLSNIEGRKGAWFANEEWKLEAFRDFDNGIGEDLYKRAYAKAFNVSPADVDKDERQIGKVMELFLQYEGGVGAFLTGALTYNIDLDELARRAWPRIPARIQDEAKDFLSWTVKRRRSTFGMDDRVFMAMEGLKRLWREAHPNITSLWKDLKDNAENAIKNPGKPFPVRRVTFIRKGRWLRCILPSGASLCYPAPQIDEKGNISYMGVNQYTRKWSRIKTYGGKFLENICQSSSRDVLAYNMFLAEKQGYEILLTVHDELITQTPDSALFSAEKLSAILATPPEWCDGLPLAAGGFETYRYRKE